jgi:hypothetical protein
LERMAWPSIAVAASLAVLPAERSQGAGEAITPGQLSYIEGCGGCHGLAGVSATRTIPPLRGSVGLFLCLREGREYIVRLPNVAFANMSDDRLAQVLNYVVFGLGGDSVPASPYAAPYTSDEVRRLRSSPLKATDLIEARRAVLTKSTQACGGSDRSAADFDEY